MTARPVYHKAGTYPGAVRVTEKSKGKRVHKDRIIAVPENDHRCNDACALNDRIREESERFFVSATELENKGRGGQGLVGTARGGKADSRGAAQLQQGQWEVTAL